MIVGNIRPLALADIPALARLYDLVLGHGAAVPKPAFQDYLAQTFLRNPWVDPELPSLIYWDEGGDPIGFIGVIPRRMVFKGRPIRVAVSTCFMVDPRRRQTLAGVHLQKAFFSGPQDLSLTDGANEASQVIWERLGGVAVPLYGFWWTRVLRPVQFVLDVVSRKRPSWSPLGNVLKPLGLAVDGMAGRLTTNDRDIGRTSQHDMDTQTLWEAIAQFSRKETLHPTYDRDALAWLLDRAGEKRQYGDLRKAVVRDHQGAVVGWYLYYRRPSAGGHVLQFVAQKEYLSRVLGQLFRDAWRAGCCSVTGRIEPRFTHEFSDHHCYFQAGTRMLIHSSDDTLLRTISRGDAFLTWLEGERWTRFLEFLD